MRIAVFSDLHVHPWGEFSRDDRGVPSRLRHAVSVMQQVRAYCVENGIRAALFGGDLFHKRGVLYTQPYNLTVAELAEWKRAGIELFANVGNHDAADRKGKVHALQALESAELIHTVDDDGWMNWHIEDKDGDEVFVTAIAYCPDATTLRQRFDIAMTMRDQGPHESSHVPCLGLFHHGFRGARVGTSLEYMVKEDADADQYAKHFVWMLSGHYHAHQEIGTRENAWYVGSPMEFVRGETSPKGFLVIDTQKPGKIKRVKIDLPRFVKLTDDDLRDDEVDIEARVKGNYVDVVFDELPVPFEKLEEVLRKRGALGVRGCPTRAAKQPKSSRLKVDPTMGDRQLLEAYMDHVGVDPSERGDLLRVGLELIEAGMK